MDVDPIGEKVAGRYRERRSEGKPGWSDKKSYQEKEACLKKILKKFAIGEKARFLELGCGAGNLTLYAAKKGLEAYGVDCCHEGIAWAKEMVKSSGLEVNLQVGNIVDLKEYGDCSFDIVFDGDCLHRILGPDRARCLASVFRVLRSGGVFHARARLVNDAFDEPVKAEQEVHFDRQKRLLVWDGVPYDFLSYKDEFLEELRSAGFGVVDLEEKADKDNEGGVYKGVLLVDVIRP
ncbi:MAG: class I SAM-dependent methyltransferase [Planctomycetota bacterium]|jgi:ubiquinone/menaquinone biosynthesis C-methylase UbiE